MLINIVGFRYTYDGSESNTQGGVSEFSISESGSWNWAMSSSKGRGNRRARSWAWYVDLTQPQTRLLNNVND